MNNRIPSNVFIIGIVSLVLVLAGGVYLFRDTLLSQQAAILNAVSPSKEESLKLAEQWITEQSPTFVFDGTNLEHRTTAQLECASCYEFTFAFQSSALGYGDRANTNAPEIPTPHTLKIQVEDGTITHAVTDGVFDELKQELLPDANEQQSDSEVRLLVADIQKGEGVAATAGDILTVHYTGALEDGTVFDSSHTRGQPFSFTLGAQEVIRGWDFGVQGMKVGGVRKLVIPPQLAYGDRQVGPIPPNSTLTFEVTLLKIETPNQ